jgi:hypothetical protein
MSSWIDPAILEQVSMETGVPYDRLAGSKYGFGGVTSKKFFILAAASVVVAGVGMGAYALLKKKKKL